MPAYVPPTSDVVPNVDIDPREVRANPLGNRLARYYRMRERGLNVYLLQNGTATLQQPWDPDNTIIRRTLHGGHLYEVSTAEQTVIQTAGVGGTFTEFDPRVQPGLMWWLAADQLGLTNGASVSSWPDLAGSHIPPLTQTDSTKQPTYVTNALNSLPVVRFDGVNDLLRSTWPLGLGVPWTWIGVFQNLGSMQALLDGPAGNQSRVSFVRSNTGTFRVTALTPTLSTALSVDGTSTATTLAVVSVTLDATLVPSIRRSGTPDPLSAVVYIGRETVGLNWQGITLGAQYDGTLPAAVDVAEMVLYERVLPVDELHQLEQDLGRKYGVTVA